MIHFVVPADQEFAIRDFLAVGGPSVAERVRVLHYEELPARTEFDRGAYIFSALDQLSPAMERLVAGLHAQLAAVDGVRVLNHPGRTLRRFELLAELRRQHRNDFRAVRATGDLTGLRYPVFLREERKHTGAISPLLESPAAVERAIGRALVQGHRPRDVLVVEFCDTADGDGFYRKYAAFVVGKRVVARGLAYGRQWMLKFALTEWSRAMALEERDYVLRNPHAEQLAQIFAIARVEYGRMDYAVKDGRIQTWEINLNPTIGRGLRPPSGRVPSELEPIRRETRECFFSGLRAALEDVDVAADGRPAVRVHLEPRTVRAALAAPRPRAPRRSIIKGVLRPAKRLLQPLTEPLLPVLGKLARGSDRSSRITDPVAPTVEVQVVK